jgi:hypothetical protein
MQLRLAKLRDLAKSRAASKLRQFFALRRSLWMGNGGQFWAIRSVICLALDINALPFNMLSRSINVASLLREALRESCPGGANC